MAENYPWMRDAFLGLAALQLSRGDEKLQFIADQYYYSAVGMLGRYIEMGGIEGTEDWLLLSTILFCLFEQGRPGVSRTVMYHLGAAAKIFRLRKVKGVVPPTTDISPFHRITAESFIYHIANVSVFFEELDQLSTNFSWDDLDEGLRSNPFPHASQDANCPIIGLPLSIYRLVFEISRLSRHTPLQGSRHVEALRYKQELEELKLTLFPIPAGLEQTVQLYTLTLSILLTRLLDPQTTTCSDARIRRLVRDAVGLIRTVHDDGDLLSNAYLCWPMTILICAVETHADAAVLRGKLAALEQGGPFNGHIRRTALVVECVWHQRQRRAAQQQDGHRGREGSTCGSPDEEEVDVVVVQDGLDLLTRRTGLFGAVNMT